MPSIIFLTHKGGVCEREIGLEDFLGNDYCAIINVNHHHDNILLFVCLSA